MKQPLVDVRGLSYSHRQGGQVHTVLMNLTLELNAGEVVVLTGPSGSGKSTLLTIVGGLRSAVDGSVRVLDTELIGAREKVRVKLRRQIGFIFQQHNLAPALTVAQNIQMGLQLSGGHRVGNGSDRIRKAAGMMSFGHALARVALGSRCGHRVALLDELLLGAPAS
jgi:putative ABC transport system ATP-binding protein